MFVYCCCFTSVWVLGCWCCLFRFGSVLWFCLFGLVWVGCFGLLFVVDDWIVSFVFNSVGVVLLW